MKEHRSPGLIVALAVLLALIGGYVGAYYLSLDASMQDRQPYYWRLHGKSHGDRDFYDWLVSIRRCQTFFFPIHWIDRRIRPNVWNPPGRVRP